MAVTHPAEASRKPLCLMMGDWRVWVCLRTPGADQYRGRCAMEDGQLSGAAVAGLSSQEVVTELAKRGLDTEGNDGELVSGFSTLAVLVPLGEW